MAFPFNNNFPGAQSSSGIHPDDILDDLIMEEAIRDSQQDVPKSIYWCHQCEKDIQQPTLPEFLCPSCGGAFIEELPADKQPPRQSSSTFSQQRQRLPQNPHIRAQFSGPMFSQRNAFMPPPPFLQMLSSMLGATAMPQPTPPPQPHPFAANQNNPFVYTFVSSSFPAPAPAQSQPASDQPSVMPNFLPPPGAHQQMLNFSE